GDEWILEPACRERGKRGKQRTPEEPARRGADRERWHSGRRLAAAAGSRHSGIAVCGGTPCQRVDRFEPGGYGPEGPDAAGAREGQQRAHRAVRRKGGAGFKDVLASARFAAAGV